MKKKIIICSLIIIFAGLLTIYDRYIILFSKKNNSDTSAELSMGIIDGDLSIEHDNILNNVSMLKNGEMQHGDQILSFLEKYNKDIKVVYYDAEIDGKISTETLIAGLKWMLTHNIDNVCISLSSDFYSDTLESWINEHKNEITIYASYNNLYNSLDYPAQYTNVIGVGSDSKVIYKEKDIQCRTNNIILIDEKIHLYSGNSYLAPLQMIIDIKGRK